MRLPGADIIFDLRRKERLFGLIRAFSGAKFITKGGFTEFDISYEFSLLKWPL
jgi:hypothetical protein